MIDTIILILKWGMYKILEPDRFNPTARDLLDPARLGGRANKSYYQNPTRRELANGIYKPNLTITKRYRNGEIEIPLKVQFSVPKLLFGNNFDELEEWDFYEAVFILTEKLKEMGIEVNETNLVFAPVSAIHFSKNIILTDGSIPYSYLKEIQKANLSQRLDFDKTDFRNEGHIVKFHTNSYEVTFYDKRKELEKAKTSDKRTEEKDNILQLHLLEELKKMKPFEVVRMETRLNTRQKIRQVLKQIDRVSEPTFSRLFNKVTSQKVLLADLGEIERAYPKTLNYTPLSVGDFVAQFMMDNPNTKIADPMTAFGFSSLVKEDGVREARELLKKYGASWYRFNKKMNSFHYPQNALPVFEPIRKQLLDFKAIKLVDFQDNMINNDKDN